MLPSGTLTFCFTDVVGSTAMWDSDPDTMRTAMARHDELVEAAIAASGGEVVRPRGEGDSRFAVFARASDAAVGALRVRAALKAEPWTTPVPLRVRLALHTGEADLRDGDYYGSAVNRCARLRAIGHPGQILVSHATAELIAEALPAGTHLIELGSQRLADLSRPEVVFQLAEAGRDERFPPLRALDPQTNNLPVQLTAFVGRAAELEAVRGALARSSLVTLTGPGGAGKTRLAVQVAAELVGGNRDGVWFVELAPLTDGELVAHVAAAALGARDVPGRHPLDAIAEHARTRSLLVVLDNCEHVLGPAAEVARRLLQSGGDVRVLATSQEPLGLAGEAVHPLATMAADDAVKLFVDRAVLAKPTFVLDEAVKPAVAQLCARLDGIPLAIELAAARVRMLPVEQIAARLDDRFRLLTGGDRDALPRHQTLRAAVDWSYRLLDASERCLLDRIAVFAGGFTLEAAEAVCAGGDVDGSAVFDLLASLVDKSLVTVDGAPADAGEPGFGMLETVRQFALGQLSESGELDEVRARHAAYFLVVARAAADAVYGPDEVAVFRRIDAVHDNLRAALTWALDSGDAATVAGLCVSLAPYWKSRARLTEGRRWLDAAMASDARAHDPKVAFNAGMLASRQDDFGAAAPLLEEALAGFEDGGDTARIADCLAHLGEVAVLQGQLDRAEELGERALQLAEEIGERTAMRLGAYLLGWVAEERGAFDRARAFFEDDLRAARARKNPVDIAHVLVTLAELSLLQGRVADARAGLAEGEALAAPVSEPQLDCYLARLGGLLALEDGDGQVATERFRLATEITVGLDRSLELTWCLGGLASAAVLSGEPERATTMFAAANALRRPSGAVEPQIEQRAYEPHLIAARAQLGTVAFQQAWASGAAMSRDEAVALALAASGSVARGS